MFNRLLTILEEEKKKKCKHYYQQLFRVMYHSHAGHGAVKFELCFCRIFLLPIEVSKDIKQGKITQPGRNSAVVEHKNFQCWILAFAE